MHTYKVVVTGPFNAGKTEFVRTASDIEIVTTERQISDAAAEVKAETTVALDYGHVKVGDALVHLYGTPGQARFEFMWEILSRDTDAFVLLVDSEERGSLMEAMQMIRLMRKNAKVPYLVAANKQDGKMPMTPQEIAKLLKLPASVPVLPCVARDRGSVLRVLEKVVTLL